MRYYKVKHKVESTFNYNLAGLQIEVENVKPYKSYGEMDQIERIMAYEQGELGEQDCIDMFQELLDTGLVWQLQGHYGRTARQLIEAGYIYEKATV